MVSFFDRPVPLLQRGQGNLLKKASMSSQIPQGKNIAVNLVISLIALINTPNRVS